MNNQPEYRLQVQYTMWLEAQLIRSESNPTGRRVLYCASLGHVRVGMGQAMKLKRAGYKKGNPDITIYEAKGGWHGMTVETKCGTYPTKEQKAWQADLLARGYYAIIIPGKLNFQEAWQYLERETIAYLQGNIKRL